MEISPQVLFAMMTDRGLAISEDDGSMFVANMGNSIELHGKGIIQDAPANVEIPFLVIATAGMAGVNVTISISVEHPDGSRRSVPVEKATKQSKTAHGVLPWWMGIDVEVRAMGVHWVHVALNGELKTSSPINIRQSESEGEDDATPIGLFQA